MEKIGCPFCKCSDIKWEKSSDEKKASCSKCGRELISNTPEELDEKIKTMINMYNRMFPGIDQKYQ